MRDFFLSFVRSLIDHLEWHSDLHEWRDYHFGMASIVKANFSGNVSAEFWWFLPDRLRRYEQRRSLGKADHVIFGIGAHYTNRSSIMEDIMFAWEKPGSGWGLKRIAARKGLIWMQYASAHFPRGNGEFEDSRQRRAPACREEV